MTDTPLKGPHVIPVALLHPVTLLKYVNQSERESKLCKMKRSYLSWSEKRKRRKEEEERRKQDSSKWSG